MAFEGYFKCKFSKQGASKGESPKQARKDWVAVRGFNFEVISPRDAATGQLSGKRQYKPVQFLKEWGASSPQFLNALAQNETIERAWFEFVKVDDTGAEYVHQTVTLTNATVSEVSQFTGAESTGGAATPTLQSEIDTLELERISLIFQKIEVENIDGKTVFADDWNLSA